MTAYALARLCYDTLLEYGVAAKTSCEAKAVTPALEHVIEANTLLSGLGFESGGLASAHSIHNGLTILPQTHYYYHGEKVAIGVLTSLFLTDKSALTAYLADHLIREGQGRGAEYRLDTLKKYRSYVRGNQDFPLREFRSRHSGATEAVGYGKSLLLFHMLRRSWGDATFREVLRTAKPGARICFRNLIIPRDVPEDLRAFIRKDEALSRGMKDVDRSFVYSKVAAYEVIK